jgi:hypothetical protein
MQQRHQHQHSTGGRQAGRDDGMVHWVLVSSAHVVGKVAVKVVVVVVGPASQAQAQAQAPGRHRWHTPRRDGGGVGCNQGLEAFAPGGLGPRRCEDE